MTRVERGSSGDDISSECLRGHNVWLSAPNPLLAITDGQLEPTVDWHVDATGEPAAVTDVEV